VKQAIVKINLGPAGAKRVRRSPLIGAIIIADEVSPVDNQRYVVIERSVAKAPAAKKGKSNAHGTVPATGPTQQATPGS